MTRYLIAAIAILALGLVLSLSRISSVTGQRDAAQEAARLANSRNDSLRQTLRLQRELASDQSDIETNYVEAKRNAEQEADRLRRCLANGTCGLRVAAKCPRVRVDGSPSSSAEPDAGAPELTAAARRAYPSLVAGLDDQRAQIIGLQAVVKALNSRCKIGVGQ